MKRRTFFKTALVSIPALYCFPGKALSVSGKTFPAACRAGMTCHPFNTVCSAALEGDHLSIPEAFTGLNLQDRFILVVPERDSSILLIPESGDDWEILGKIFDAGGRDGMVYLRQHAEITEDGMLCLPGNVRRFAGIRTPAVDIVRHGNVIEITDSKSLHSKTA